MDNCVHNKYVNLGLVLSIFLGSLNWITLPIPFTSRHISFMLSEVVIGILSIYLFYKMWKKTYTISSKPIKILFLLFMLYIMIAMVYRILYYGFDMEYFTYPRVSYCLIILYFLFDSNILKKEYLKISILITISLLNVLEFVFFLLNSSIRISTIAININIYSLLALLCIPLLVRLFMEKEDAVYVRWMAAVNFVVICVLMPYTGSRTSFYLMLGIILYTFTVTYKKGSWKTLFGMLLFVVGFFFMTYMFIASPVAESSLWRATMLDKVMKIENDDLRYEISEDVPMEDESNEDDAADEKVQDKKLQHTSDIIRSKMWTSAIENIKKDMWLGRGIVTFDVEMNQTVYQQSPHNFVLELLLSYGFIGTLLYGMLLAAVFWQQFEKGTLHERLYKLLYIVVLLIFSCFQPTMLSYICIFMCSGLLFLEDFDAHRKSTL
ncbi:MAG: O-antigen ligase family protein [Erysipelotrichaceae bacterium]|jgi:O-antigen ligase|nr:O-antigen ligase family protein [Erysipelotrichaceae bacterium]